MEQKQRILLVHNYYKIPGGEDTVVANERQLLEQHGHSVFLYTRSNGEMDSFSPGRKLLLPFTSLFSLRTYRDVKRLISEKQIDIVHVHNTLNLVSPSVYYAAFACKVPVVQTLHNFRLLCPAATFLREGKVCEECVEGGLGCAVRYGCYRGSKLQSLMSAMILKLHRMLGTYRKLNYICLTEFNREKLLLLNRKDKPIIQEDRVFIKSNFVWEPKLETGEKEEQFIFVGRLERLKGIHVLLEAWKEFPDKKLILCGIGPEEEWVRNYLKKNHMNQVELRGQVEHREVLRLLARSRALILPNLCYEGQSMVIMESYAVGTPVIASDLGNPGNMVIPGVTGLKFPCSDVKALRKAIRQMEQMQEWDTETVYKNLYAEETNYAILYDIYRKVQEKNE